MSFYLPLYEEFFFLFYIDMYKNFYIYINIFLCSSELLLFILSFLGGWKNLTLS